MNFIRGTARITVNDRAERVINRVSAENIILWGVSKTEDSTVFYTHRKNAAKVRALYPESSAEILGLSVHAKRIFRRTALVIPALVLFVLWWISGQLVWEYDISGNETVYEFEIIRVLNENGAGYGSVGWRIDSEKLSNVVLCEIPELSWFAINVTGSRASVSVRERIAAPDIVDPDELVNVYAEKAGKVVSVEVYDGTRLVSTGDEVEEGQLLVSGITASYTGVRQEHALARIYAETEYELCAMMPKACGMKVETGEVVKRYSLEVCGRRFGLYRNGKRENAQKRESEKRLELFGAVLPVSVVTEEFCCYDTVQRQLTDEQCAEILKAELSDRLRKETDGDVLEVSFDTDSEGGVVYVTLYAKVRERIA